MKDQAFKEISIPLIKNEIDKREQESCGVFVKICGLI